MATIATLKDLVDALTETGLENNNLETIITDLKTFFNVVSTNLEIKNVLGTSAFEVDEKSHVISDISGKVNLLNETKNFLILAVELDKFSRLLSKQDEIIRRLEQSAGKLKAEIISAGSMSETDLNRIKDSLYKATGRNVELTVNVDPSIIGGLITIIGDKVFDNSIKTQLEKIQGVLTP
jgi:F-type H+-transporting ATPase subunit delta